jgi:electron transport complex protein RnfA
MALGAGLGFFLVLVVMASIRRRLELAPIPKPLRGLPIMLITTGLLAIALLGFRF